MLSYRDNDISVFVIFAASYANLKKNEKAFKYTWKDIHIFAKLRNINLSDTTHVSVNQYIDGQKGIPVWEIDIRDSIQPDMARVILIHGETGEVMMDSYE